MYLPLLKPIVRISLLIASAIVYLLTIFAAYGGRFNPDFFTVPAMLTLALPYLSIATFLITIAWFAFGKIFGGVLGVLALIASWGPVSTASPVGSSKKAAPGASTFSLMTYNMIHGWDMEGKDSTANRTIQYILDSGADIVCLQELLKVDSVEIPKFTREQKEDLEKKYPYIAGNGKNDQKVLSKYPVEMLDPADFIDGDIDRKRYSFYRASVKGHALTIINVHLRSYFLTEQDCDSITSIESIRDVKRSWNLLKGPVREKLSAGFKKRKVDTSALRQALDRMDGPVIVCGDFNDVPESYAYRLLKGNDLKDAYVQTSFGPLVTYNRHMFWFHLDQILYRGPLRALDVRKGKLKASDHYPLIAEFEFTDIKPQ